MLKFYYYPAPTPAKVALLLEEFGLPYKVVNDAEAVRFMFPTLAAMSARS